MVLEKDMQCISFELGNEASGRRIVERNSMIRRVIALSHNYFHCFNFFTEVHKNNCLNV